MVSLRVWKPIVCLAALVAVSAALFAGEDAAAVFEKLKGLEGSWHGEAAGTAGEALGEEHAAKHEFRVSAAGTVLMEIMGPGGADEMINMYHLDGEDLVLTHYCAGGNQPTMKLDRGRLAEGALYFDFSGGSNLDPMVDGHIHSAKIVLVDDEHIQSSWTAWRGGQEAGVMNFSLSRQKGE